MRHEESGVALVAKVSTMVARVFFLFFAGEAGPCYLITHLLIICRASQKSWDDFFLIVETIDEKQVHLVKQVVPRLCGLYGNGDVDLQPSWVLVIFEIMFVHQVSEEKVLRTAIVLIPFRHILST